jgi:hypothetical protein
MWARRFAPRASGARASPTAQFARPALCSSSLRRPRPTVLARGGPEIAEPERASQLEELRALFKAFDTDGSG